ncbi:unnamed protein product [Trypanosoma congolense IL3000]|uniref:WGS project CAEQ00000000 data, annotated contig 2367 n=1 Tax=Trypanosoma congolense (strain IL3000) TaxID=1068625 RepID=F9WDI0_TRYCI|nr:unnamed protein product [Trypanosoma congolense IL3000]
MPLAIRYPPHTRFPCGSIGHVVPHYYNVPRSPEWVTFEHLWECHHSSPQWRLWHAGEARDSCFVAVPFLPTCWLSPMPAVTPLNTAPVGTCRRRNRAPNAAWGQPALWDLRPPFRTVQLTTSALVSALPPIWKAVSSCTELHCSLQAAEL